MSLPRLCVWAHFAPCSLLLGSPSPRQNHHHACFGPLWAGWCCWSTIMKEILTISSLQGLQNLHPRAYRYPPSHSYPTHPPSSYLLLSSLRTASARCAGVLSASVRGFRRGKKRQIKPLVVNSLLSTWLSEQKRTAYGHKQTWVFLHVPLCMIWKLQVAVTVLRMRM